MAVVYLGDAAPETVAQLYRQKSAGLTWECESYPMANGNTALIPHCTSNPNSMPYVQSSAYFAQDGILYQIYCRPHTDGLDYSVKQEILAPTGGAFDPACNAHLENINR